MPSPAPGSVHGLRFPGRTALSSFDPGIPLDTGQGRPLPLLAGWGRSPRTHAPSGPPVRCGPGVLSTSPCRGPGWAVPCPRGRAKDVALRGTAGTL